MNKFEKPDVKPNSSGQKADDAKTEAILSAGAIDALADIAKRISRLAGLHSERLKADDGYHVIDPRTVVSAFQEIVQTAQVDPTRTVHEQFKLWADMSLLWQQTV